MQLKEPCREAEKRFKTGYGRLPGGGYAHRAAWAAVNGPIPPGVLIRHLCHNPPCYEITHLRAGTQKDNMQDSVKDGRLGKRKLDHEAITREYLAGDLAPDIAERHGCRVWTVSKIVRKYAPEATAARHGQGRWL